MNILVAGAWPYANGSLHIGHLSALLPGDVIARFYRKNGDNVLYVSGSDCHGTPISIRADKENVAPIDIAKRYHKEFKYCFEKLGFSYDCYSKTYDTYHEEKVKDIIKLLYKNGFIYEKEIEQLYCENCKRFLPDRFVEGICPVCGSIARGDQCDNCSTLLDPVDLKNRRCKICGNEPVIKKSRQLFFALSKFQNVIKNGLEKNKSNWRINAVNNTERYINEGLKDRAISRDLSWGIDIPIKGFEDKKIYVWIDAVLGYLTLSQKWAQESGENWRKFWDNDAVTYFIYGKDNIPFHTVILPALLKGIGIDKYPDRVISSEYTTLEGRKISTSGNWAVWVPDIVDKYNPDLIRYFFIVNAPEKRDTDFSWNEFVNSNNGELLGAYGNLVNRNLVFVKKYLENKIPVGIANENLKSKIDILYKSTGEKIKCGKLKSSIEEIFEFIRSINKYFDENTPWITLKNDTDKCKNTIYNCIFCIANIANLLEPFLPFSSQKILGWLSVKNSRWETISVEPGTELKEFSVLFKRLDTNIIDEEIKRLGANNK